jgi:hypothetical protein
MSYKEKSIWLSFGLTLYLIYFYYSGLSELRISGSFTESAFTTLLFTTAVWLTVISIVVHSIAAILDHKEADKADDERDKLIELYGCRVGYYMLAFGVVASIVHSQLGQHFMGVLSESSALAGTVDFMHIIIMSYLIANVAKFFTQLFYYRRGF